MPQISAADESVLDASVLDTSAIDTSVIDLSVMETSEMVPARPGKTFKQHLVEELCCSYCLLVLDEPMMTACDHLFCKKCLTNYMKKCAHCPTCKQVINAKTNRPVPTPISNILDKLKKMRDIVFPYNQPLMLSCAVESIELDVDETETNRTSANPDPLSNLHKQVLSAIATEPARRGPSTADQARNRSGRSNQNLRSELENSMNTVLDSLANSTPVNATSLQRPPATAGQTGNQLIVNVMSVVIQSPQSGNVPASSLGDQNANNDRTSNSNRTSNSRSTATRSLGAASIYNATPSSNVNQPFRSPVRRALANEANSRRAGSAKSGQQEQANVSKETPVIKKSLKYEFEEECHCSICLTIMQDPCLLPCNHVYCEHCILTWLKMDDKTCPICKKFTVLSTVKSGPRVLRKIILKLNALPDVDLEATKKRKIQVICLDEEPSKRPVPKSKNYAGAIPLVTLE